MKSIGPPIPRLRPEVEQVARATGSSETSPALNVRAHPTCQMMIVRRSRLQFNRDIVTAPLHVFGAPAGGVRQFSSRGASAIVGVSNSRMRSAEFRRLNSRSAPDLGGQRSVSQFSLTPFREQSKDDEPCKSAIPANSPPLSDRPHQGIGRVARGKCVWRSSGSAYGHTGADPRSGRIRRGRDRRVGVSHRRRQTRRN